MIPYIIILVTASAYAFIRAKHDSFITQGKWKTWAFVEGVYWCVMLVALVLLSFGLRWWMGIVLGPLFAFYFWTVFDCAVGYYFSGSIFYLGNQGFDLTMRKTFKYNLPIFGWKSGSLIFILFKVFWIVLLSFMYFSLI